MKELKKRIKGLSAILLAVSLAIGMSEVPVFAGTTYNICAYGDDGTFPNGSGYLEKKSLSTHCSDKTEFVAGDKFSMETGGNFIIDREGSSYGMFSLNEDGNGLTSDYMDIYTDISDSNFICWSLSFKDSFPSECKAIRISSAIDTGIKIPYTDGPTYYKITFELVYNTTTVEAGKSMSLTTGTRYSFPSGSNTHKVQGDPTNYYTTDFYVSSSGTYTILQ